MVFNEARVGFHHIQEDASSNISPSSFTAPSSLADSILRSDNSSDFESVREPQNEQSSILLVSHLNQGSTISSPLMPNVDLGASGTPSSTHVSVGTRHTQEDKHLHEPSLEDPRGDISGDIL